MTTWTGRMIGPLDPAIARLALDLAARVREAVSPSLGDPGARTGVGVAPGGVLEQLALGRKRLWPHMTSWCALGP